jgi:sec-independent protein translocase protein TatB
VFNLSGSEIVVILLLALVILGPEKLPGAMRKAGKTFAELKKLSNGFQEEVRKGFEEPTKEVRQTAAAVRSATKLPSLDRTVKNALTGKSSKTEADKPTYNPATDPAPEQPAGSSVAEPLGPDAAAVDDSEPIVEPVVEPVEVGAGAPLAEPAVDDSEPVVAPVAGAVDAEPVAGAVDADAEPVAEADRRA